MAWQYVNILQTLFHQSFKLYCRPIPDAKRTPFDDRYIIGLIWQQRSQLMVATACLLFCTASNLAAPVLTGMLMDTLVKQKPVEEYVRLLAILMFGYIVEPCLTKVLQL